MEFVHSKHNKLEIFKFITNRKFENVALQSLGLFHLIVTSSMREVTEEFSFKK